MNKLVMVSLIFIICLCSSVLAGELPVIGQSIEIVTPDDRARVCPYPFCGDGEHIARVQTGTKFKIIDYVKKQWGYAIEINYKGKVGYISEFDVKFLK
ncbi:MAG: hypothetical protein EOM37_11685 [Proteobacteria bacterium]|nr:hypothetical protein [Pseudomonadota bacterium]